MRRNNIFKSVFLISLFLILSFSVQAFEVRVNPVNGIIHPSETAEVEIVITNEGSTRHDIILSTADFRWQILSDPLSDYFTGVHVPGNGHATVRLSLTPRGDLFLGIYSVRFELYSRSSGESRFVDVPVEIRSPYTGTAQYSPTVVIDGSINSNNRIDPRTSSVLVVNLDNRNPLNITSMDVIIESDFFSETFTTSLGPLEQRRVEFNFDVDNFEEPRIADVVMRLVYKGRNIGSTPKSFPVQVVAYSDIVRDTDESSGFLSNDKVVKLTNNGNIENNDVLKVSTNFFSRIFTRASPSPVVERGETETFLVWDVNLNPGSTAEIKVSVNYRPLLYFFLVSLAVLVLYYMLRSPVVIKKTASGINMYEGGISEVKVLMHIKNRTPKNFNSFSVTEYVPKIAKFLKSDSLGSIQPTKVLNHEKKGTLLKWNFEAIEPFEERIIIYKMKLNFTVIGRLNLPPTTVKFKDESSGSYTTKSNNLKIANLNREKENKRGNPDG